MNTTNQGNYFRVQTHSENNIGKPGNFVRILFYLHYSLECVKIWITNQEMFVTVLKCGLFSQTDIPLGFAGLLLTPRNFGLTILTPFSLKLIVESDNKTSCECSHCVRRPPSDSFLRPVYLLSAFAADGEKTPFQVSILRYFNYSHLP